MRIQNIKVPKISQREFWQRLKERKYENIEVIKMVERLLIEKRGYVFKMPRKNTPVILLLSGGLDSIVVWALLLNTYQYQVYPVFFRRVEKRYKREKKAINFFYRLLKKENSVNCQPPFEFPAVFISNNFEKETHKPEFLHRKHILDSLNLKTHTASYVGTSVLTYLYPFFATAYSRYLFEKQNLKIPYIFSAVTAIDGEEVPSQTFSALRTTMLDMCLATCDYSWQFTSFLFEKEIGHFARGEQVIKMGDGLKLPLEKTWSCFKSSRVQCGGAECRKCTYRKNHFKKAGVVDRTPYKDNMRIVGLKDSVSWHLERVKKHLEDKLGIRAGLKEFNGKNPMDIRSKIKIKLIN